MALVVTGLLIGAFLRVRKYPPFGSRARLNAVDIAVLGLAPGIVAAVIIGDLGAFVRIGGVQLLVVPFVLLGVGVIYAVVALGIPELTGWGLRPLRQNCHIAPLAARTLPCCSSPCVPAFAANVAGGGALGWVTWWRDSAAIVGGSSLRLSPEGILATRSGAV